MNSEHNEKPCYPFVEQLNSDVYGLKMKRHLIRTQTEPVLCKNDCGFYGNPANDNLCSKCYKDQMKLHSTSEPFFPKETTYVKPSISTRVEADDKVDEALTRAGEDEAPKEAESAPDRCHKCDKLIGILGFKCRCDSYFCAQHRQANAHECPFDYKSLFRSQLITKNQKVVRDKLERI